MHIYRARLRELIKPSSNRISAHLYRFREFYYIQMEKYARQAVSEGVKNVEDLRVGGDSEIYRVLNLHYNRNNHIEVWGPQVRNTNTHTLHFVLFPSRYCFANRKNTKNEHVFFLVNGLFDASRRSIGNAKLSFRCLWYLPYDSASISRASLWLTVIIIIIMFARSVRQKVYI